MKLALIGTVVLTGAAVASDIDTQTQAFHPTTLCLDGARDEIRNPRYFMEEVESEPGVDYSMQAVAPRDDRHYFILSPPLPDMHGRLCDLDWLHDLVPEGRRERFEFER